MSRPIMAITMMSDMGAEISQNSDQPFNALFLRSSFSSICPFQFLHSLSCSARLLRTAR
jgi:hypothetical protein